MYPLLSVLKDSQVYLEGRRADTLTVESTYYRNFPQHRLTRVAGTIKTFFISQPQ